MTPITETYYITIAFSQTSSISLTTQTISDTYVTTGVVYIPYVWSGFNPYVVLASLMILLAVGVSMKKPTAFILIWIGLLISGVFFQTSIFVQFAVLLVTASFMIYKMLVMRDEV